MTIGKELNDGIMTFKISGWLDTTTAPELESELNEVDTDIKELVFDCAELEYISSAGLRQVVAAHKKMDGKLSLINVTSEIMYVFKMTGLNKRLNIK